MIELDEDQKELVEKIENMRIEIEGKADKLAVEQIERYQMELINIKKGEKSRLQVLEKSSRDPELICHDCIDNDDMETAFLTVLRYIEIILGTKAESQLVEEKSSIEYVETLFDRLNVMSRQQISDSNAMLKNVLETRLNKLFDNFTDFSTKVTTRLNKCEAEISHLEDMALNSKLIEVPKFDTQHIPIQLITEKTKPVIKKRLFKKCKLQPMRASIRRGEENPDLMLSSGVQ
ncbi:hypothetical protein TVAG_018170 [Trichomonas vaginalis G3]|uniref:Uncharacterized protein n=1 Tax=Trichomonas vaginalis (strain ATCC PRA-98 / G3) TaxID=412133 RepID=A2F9V3_TRIV3|nr:hypothetical protein TVAGG3_0506800 [Trichomonas vaginalis G3]EAX98281.1 hypothetical protein TVAG_018170 [Trichomonas vaginalis G3]KAI5517488.1 hypothetical protein TVAGG3_0506800 [Trichomonas vaginalis G3]|eukprot:XP_001311211.1 hypothetical protein [Trichomonas vaginalis G3]